MTDGNERIRRRRLSERADLTAALDAAAIEHIEVNEQRTVVIYRNAILRLLVTEGQLTAARTFAIELWERPDDSDGDPTRLLTSFVDDVLAVLDELRG
jgi:hypothetical protein